MYDRKSTQHTLHFGEPRISNGTQSEFAMLGRLESLPHVKYSLETIVVAWALAHAFCH